MQTNIRKWGNSAGAIIPAGALAKAGISLGDTVELDVREGQITLKQASPKFTLEELLEASPEGAKRGESLTLQQVMSRLISDPR